MQCWRRVWRMKSWSSWTFPSGTETRIGSVWPPMTSWLSQMTALSPWPAPRPSSPAPGAFRWAWASTLAPGRTPGPLRSINSVPFQQRAGSPSLWRIYCWPVYSHTVKLLPLTPRRPIGRVHPTVISRAGWPARNQKWIFPGWPAFLSWSTRCGWDSVKNLFLPEFLHGSETWKSPVETLEVSEGSEVTQESRMDPSPPVSAGWEICVYRRAVRFMKDRFPKVCPFNKHHHLIFRGIFHPWREIKSCIFSIMDSLSWCYFSIINIQPWY